VASVALKIVIATDAWKPQINGVVTTLSHVEGYLRAQGCEVRVIHPGDFHTFALPNYKEICVAWNVWKFAEIFESYKPDCVHIATEGPIGLAARRYLTKRGLPFTTSLHTKFPEYVNQRIGMPVSWGYAFLRWFHEPSKATLVTTESMRDELTARGLKDLVVWTRGVDTQLFCPEQGDKSREGSSQPVMVYVGRVAIEKNIEAFLDLPIEGTKVIVGDGPARAKLQAAYPQAHWVGYQTGADLARHYANADVFVFPSKTDTYGIVMLEAMACGVPVAGYPATGTVDVVQEGVNGAIDADLTAAVRRALSVSRDSCRAYAMTKSWDAVGELFRRELVAGPSSSIADTSGASSLTDRAA
jgi:glycosyltransferase involved in cell wall biosynthesis